MFQSADTNQLIASRNKEFDRLTSDEQADELSKLVSMYIASKTKPNVPPATTGNLQSRFTLKHATQPCDMPAPVRFQRRQIKFNRKPLEGPSTLLRDCPNQMITTNTPVNWYDAVLQELMEQTGSENPHLAGNFIVGDGADQPIYEK
jgi:hypothetical protein